MMMRGAALLGGLAVLLLLGSGIQGVSIISFKSDKCMRKLQIRVKYIAYSAGRHRGVNTLLATLVAYCALISYQYVI